MRVRSIRLLVSALLCVPAIATSANASMVLSGGDASEGLTLVPANVVYAVRFGSDTTTQAIQGANFVHNTVSPSTSNVTVNSLITNFTFGLPTLTNDTGTTNDNNMKSLVGASVYGGLFTGIPIDITLNNLTGNTTYQISVIAPKGNGSGRDDILKVNAVTLDSVTFNTTNAFVLTGTFTTGPSATTAAFILDGNASIASQAPIISGLVLSIVPEPSSLALFAFGAISLWGVGRRRMVCLTSSSKSET